MMIPTLIIQVKGISREEFLKKLKNGEIKCPLTGKTVYYLEPRLTNMELKEVKPMEPPSFAPFLEMLNLTPV